VPGRFSYGLGTRLPGREARLVTAAVE